MPDNAIAQRLAKLSALEDSLLNLGSACLKAYGGALYSLDLMATAAVKRSLAQIAGFRRMIEDRNAICAGALLRLQLDTAIRFYAAFIVPDPHAFAHNVLKGIPIRKLKDQQGRFMTDSYLIKKLVAESSEHAWIARVYEETSGYVHFSDKHIFSIFAGIEEKERTVHIQVSATDIDLPEGIYLEMIGAFVAATELFMKYLYGWGFTKQNPKIVATMREARESIKQ